ncbi:MAG: GNAT family N-acetyltransferase [Alphaproteobacteria bacterium]|nr:GNAT family N-acetyltransferase [Alphaproteobacteria bacterium]
MVRHFYVKFFLLLFLFAGEGDASEFLLQTERTLIRVRHFYTDPYISHKGLCVLNEGVNVRKTPYKRGLFFSAFKHKTEKLIASIDFFEFEKQERIFELAIAVDSTYQGKGYAPEILKQLLPHLSNTLKNCLIVAQCDYVTEEKEPTMLNDMFGIFLSTPSFLERGGMTYFGTNAWGFKGYYYAPLHKTYRETLDHLGITPDPRTEFYPRQWGL